MKIKKSPYIGKTARYDPILLILISTGTITMASINASSAIALYSDELIYHSLSAFFLATPMSTGRPLPNSKRAGV
jgi:hypothetical protein